MENVDISGTRGPSPQSVIALLSQPRGFIRLLQFIFSICAFATTANFVTSFSYKVECTNGNSSVINHEISYPYRPSHETDTVEACGKTVTVNYFGDFASDSQFFVAAGVLVMLYAAVSFAYYVFRDDTYLSNKSVPLADFMATMVAAVLWLSGSAAWASGLTGLKSVTNPDNFFKYIPHVCANEAVAKCSTVFAGNFAGLNISIIFGFLNFFLWTANLWFLYKETAWFQPPGGNTSPGV